MVLGLIRPEIDLMIYCTWAR